MAPVDPDYLNNNLKPLLFLGAQTGLLAVLGGVIGRFYYTAHSSVPPAKHTRHRHSVERSRLPLFLTLGVISTTISLVSRVNWIASSVFDWLYEGQGQHALGQGMIPLGLWWQDAAVLEQYFYGVLGDPTYFLFTFQNLVGVVAFSLFAGIEGRHRNLPVYVTAAFVLFAQTVSLAGALNFFFAVLTLVPIPLSTDDETKGYPDLKALLAPGLLAMTWVVSIPAFLDRPSWPLVSYAGYIAIPLGIVAIANSPVVPNVTTVSEARRNYAILFRTLSLYAFVLFLVELSAILFKTREIAVQESRKHNYLWLLRHKQDLSWSDQAWMTLSRILGTLSNQNAVITGVLWDVLLTAVSLSVYAYKRNIQINAILSCLGLATWNTHSSIDTQYTTSQSKLRRSQRHASPEEETPRKRRGRPKLSTLPSEDDNQEADNITDQKYSPTPRVREVISMTESLALTDNSEEQSTESGALAWTLFVVGGLPTAICAVLGGELSGG